MKWSAGKQLLATQPSITLCFPLQQLTATSFRRAPLLLADSTEEGRRCAREEALPEITTAPDRWPRNRRWMSGGVGRAAVRVSLCQERVTTAWLCVLHRQKNDVCSEVSVTVWGTVVLSPYFIYFCLPAARLSLDVTSNEWGKAY